ncbi:MAG: ATP-binding cassette, subfamily B, bacterial [uncultured Thiotrichaceae bacterium]|uniref:ATP-binding cassette, subfamily B, bacterial n=1 Tax=uncultured Thiotrichaceae bacterium TaxID=298394 RepID=A0A6S6UKJ2_9GAMM|nr:MAG: ATP-binding cassette, subfamily B, bacterial [uncultured Thiotrichaceae bacterium]
MNIIFKEYGRIILQKKGYFLVILLALATATSLDIITPLFYKNIANGFASEYSDSTLTMLMENFFSIMVIYGCIWLSWRVLEFAMIPFESGGIKILEKRIFAVLMQQKHYFFENQFSGSLIKQSGRFVSAFESIMDWLLFQLFQNVLVITVSFIIFYQQQPEFAIYFLIWVVVFISWNVGFSIWKLRFDKAVAEWNSKIGAVYSDAISNISIVKSFALERKEQAKTNQIADEGHEKRRIAWILIFISFAVQGLLTFAIELLLIYLMIQKWKQGSFDVGEFVLFQSILLMLIHRLWDFGRYFRNFFSAIADASEMADVFNNTDIETESPHAKPITIKRGDIHFDQVDFAYNDTALFEQFSLHIKPGEKVALVGHSGSGKSTLTKLLFRFFDPQQGSISFDGHQANEFSLLSLRKQISMVPQQPELFHRSIRDNISLGKNITDDEIKDAAKRARCLEFIEQLSEGFETLVGERGVKLSGGEKQRIAIARAFLEDAPIVVLDEATSALDSLTEKEIQKAIFELIDQKTAIVIAHRLSTILHMDRIIVLDHGRIIEEGSHHQLLEKRGKYFEMWQHQSGEFPENLPLNKT